MVRKKQVIGKDGLMKTVVKVERSHQERVAQHRHGRGTAKYSHQLPVGVSTTRYVLSLVALASLIGCVVWGLLWIF